MIDLFLADGPGQGGYEGVQFDRPPETITVALSQIDGAAAILEPGDDLALGEVEVVYVFEAPAFVCCRGCGGCHVSYWYRVRRDDLRIA